ncbi:hypothetical protein ANN_19524 [Periplaneta americana]|uniref:Uncharacterized protein n=1 Tax=Periplaneta americana TaxID=6978 RepID=A0ABQ8SA52_PERAM|nr:hypothetical protein ANN_19524 [Periplaneta americana]
MSPGSSTESYPAFARIGLRENPGKTLTRATYKHQILCFVTQNSCRDIKIVGRSIWRSSNEKKTQVYAWHKRFSGGRDSIKDDVRSGRPTTATNEAIAQRVRNVVTDDRRKTIKEIAAEVGISVGSVHNVLHKHLNMHYVSQKLVPKMLSAEQKETRMTLAGDMISMADEDGDFLNKIIAGDETWCNLYDPVPKRQSSEWKSKHLLGSKNFLGSLPKAKLCWKFSSTLRVSSTISSFQKVVL